MSSSDCVIALDVGGTAIKGSLVDRFGKVAERHEWSTPTSDEGNAALRRVLECVDEMNARAASLGRVVHAAGVVIPGMVDEERGFSHFAGNLGWRDLPIRDLISDHVGMPVAMGHDVRSAARAEAQLGAGRGASEFVYMVVSTGICASWLRNGEVQTGSHGIAGEFGHIVMDPDGAPCYCGKRGCLEPLASARAMETQYAERTGQTVSAQELLERMQRGDDMAREIIEGAVRWIALGVANLCAVLDPELVVIGGGFAGAGDVLLAPIRADLATLNPATEVVTADLGRDAGCVGAALAAWRAAS